MSINLNNIKFEKMTDSSQYKAINELWNEVVDIDGFYKPLELNEHIKKLESINGFSFDGTILVYDGDILIGLGIGILKSTGVGAINCILVKTEYRNNKIGEKILEKLEEYFKENGCLTIFAYGYLPSCYGWYIPRFDKHDHPCAPGIRVNSPEYLFLLKHRYEASGFQEAFHLNLSDYELPKDIKDILDKNEKDGITIELYNPDKHYGIEEFYKELNIYDFEKVIRENLSLENPYPFLVISDNGKIVGWTGALWNEESGRGHFDGIANLSSVRGRGLGKALFALLGYHSKLNGAKFMTFYTGSNNHAKYIYQGAGFKIVQTFAIMKKTLK